MKPWRPYWKGLEEAMKALLAINPRFSGEKVFVLQDWLRDLTMHELEAANFDCRTIWEGLMKKGQKFTFSPTIWGDGHRLQLYLRCMCALHFCQGRFGGRKAFNWDRHPPEVYRDLLIDLWFSQSAYWVSKCAPEVVESDDFVTSLALEIFESSPPKNLN